MSALRDESEVEKTPAQTSRVAHPLLSSAESDEVAVEQAASGWFHWWEVSA